MEAKFRGPQLTDEQKQAFGSSLKELRLSHSLSLEAVATAAGLTKAAIHQYEIGKSVPTLGAVVAITRLAGLDAPGLAIMGAIARAAWWIILLPSRFRKGRHPTN